MSRHVPANTSLSRTTLFIAFGISGLAALIFELVWTRLLLLSLGTTAAAVGVVLGAFMGGMAVGSALSGHRAVNRLDPILAFACLEGWIGLYALGSPTLLSLIGSVDHRGAQFGLALALLVPATAAMGASLPVLARVVEGDGARRSATIGRLYAANTAGAVLGPVLAVTWLFSRGGIEHDASAWSQSGSIGLPRVVVAAKAGGGAADPTNDTRPLRMTRPQAPPRPRGRH